MKEKDKDNLIYAVSFIYFEAATTEWVNEPFGYIASRQGDSNPCVTASRQEWRHVVNPDSLNHHCCEVNNTGKTVTTLLFFIFITENNY